MDMRKIILVLASLYLIAFILGVVNLLDNNFSGIAWVFAPMGIFIWGDALIISPFMIAGLLWLYKKKSNIWTGLFLSVFVMVRSFIEIPYSLNAQFSSSVRPWELGWRDMGLVKNLDITEIFVLSQLGFTCIFIISTLFFISYLKKFLKN